MTYDLTKAPVPTAEQEAELKKLQDQAADEAAEKAKAAAAAKRPTPTEMLEDLFPSKISKAELNSLKAGTPVRVDNKVVALIKRRLDSARKRETRARANIKTFSKFIRERAEVTASGDLIHISQDVCNAYRIKKAEAKTQLLRAKRDIYDLKEMYTKVVNANISFEMEQSKVLSLEANKPSVTRRTLKMIQDAGNNGHKNDVTRLRSLAKNDDRKEFRKRFEKLLSSINLSHLEYLNYDRSVKTEIMLEVMKRI